MVSNTNKVIRLHYLKSGIVLPNIANDGTIAAEVQGLALTSAASSSNEAQGRAPRPRRIRCKLCRKEVATRDDFMDHSNGHAQNTSSAKNVIQGPMISRSCSGYFIEPVSFSNHVKHHFTQLSNPYHPVALLDTRADDIRSFVREASVPNAAM